jgi:hypothetical protein
VGRDASKEVGGNEMNGLTREEWLKLDKSNEEPEPDRSCLDCHKQLDKWLIAYPTTDPDERGVLCVMCWGTRLGVLPVPANP